MAFQKTNLMLNGSIGYDYYKSSELDLKNDRLNGSVFANITQYLPWKLQASAYVGMWCGGISSVYGHSGSINFHGLSLQRSFLKEDRLTVQLMAANPFTNAMTYKSYTTQGDVTGWSSSENRRWSRQFVLTVSYRFGSLKTSVKKTSKTIENDDLIGNSKQNSGGATGAAGAGNTPGGGRGGN